MAKPGWLTIRNIPEIPSDSSYFVELKLFFKSHILCPKCRGRGANQKRTAPIREDATIRFMGIKELEKLNGRDDVSITDVIRDILEHRRFRKRSCGLCRGSRFVEKDKAKEFTKGKRGTDKRRNRKKAG